MHVTLTGNLGSGKSTICNYISEKYGYTVYSTGTMHRDIAARMGISTLQLNELMRSDYSYDKVIDSEIEKISMSMKDRDILFDSRLAFHFAKNAFNVFTVIDPVEAAARVCSTSRGAVECYADVEDARQQLKRRSTVENIRFKELYGVDNLNLDNYHLVIDTSWCDVSTIAERLIQCACTWNQNEPKFTQFLLSPKSVYPTTQIGNLSNDKIQELVECNSKEYISDPISVVCYDDYFYAIDGHHRLLSAQINHLDYISAKRANPRDFASNEDETRLIRDIKNAGMKTLSDFEGIGGFRYKSYPKHYE